MNTDQVNRLITDEVETIDDADIKKFIKDILAHERKNIDRERYEYKTQYKNLLREYAPDSEDNDD